jgi:hypothetical protein
MCLAIFFHFTTETSRGVQLHFPGNRDGQGQASKTDKQLRNRVRQIFFHYFETSLKFLNKKIMKS